MKKFFYRVKKNDSLLSLSEKFSIPFSKIITDNDLKAEVSEGDIIYLESNFTAQVYTVTPMDAILNPQKIAKAVRLGWIIESRQGIRVTQQGTLMLNQLILLLS